MQRYPKIAFDLYIVQMTWTAFFLGIMLIIHIFKMVGIPFFGDGNVDYFYTSSYIAANIYMLVIGIIAITFLPYYVEHGITRKDYFKGTLLAALGVAITIPILTMLLSLLDQWLLGNLFNATYRASEISTVVSEVGEDAGDFIGWLVQSIILSPYIDFLDNWLFALIVFAVNIFTYYLLGWLIGASFYHSGIIAGLGTIVVAIVLLTVEDTMLRIALDLPVIELFAGLELIPGSIAGFIVLLILIITAFLIRLFTKRVRIKM